MAKGEDTTIVTWREEFDLRVKRDNAMQVQAAMKIAASSLGEDARAEFETMESLVWPHVREHLHTLEFVKKESEVQEEIDAVMRLEVRKDLEERMLGGSIEDLDEDALENRIEEIMESDEKEAEQSGRIDEIMESEQTKELLDQQTDALMNSLNKYLPYSLTMSKLLAGDPPFQNNDFNYREKLHEIWKSETDRLAETLSGLSQARLMFIEEQIPKIEHEILGRLDIMQMVLDNSKATIKEEDIADEKQRLISGLKDRARRNIVKSKILDEIKGGQITDINQGETAKIGELVGQRMEQLKQHPNEEIERAIPGELRNITKQRGFNTNQSDLKAEANIQLWAENKAKFRLKGRLFDAELNNPEKRSAILDMPHVNRIFHERMKTEMRQLDSLKQTMSSTTERQRMDQTMDYILERGTKGVDLVETRGRSLSRSRTIRSESTHSVSSQGSKRRLSPSTQQREEERGRGSKRIAQPGSLKRTQSQEFRDRFTADLNLSPGPLVDKGKGPISPVAEGFEPHVLDAPILVPYYPTARELESKEKGHNPFKDIVKGKKPSTSKRVPSIDEEIRKAAGSSTIMEFGNIAGSLPITLRHHDPLARFSLGTTSFNGVSVSVVIRSTDCHERTGWTMAQIRTLPLSKLSQFSVKAIEPKEKELSATQSQATGSDVKKGFTR